MSYQALLFCPDDKTARTVTQVLSELEFNVESCTEPFAAVKKLMGEHFDAVVVDCDNEQNATLLFKSARNSTSNQASLAVAVVEGQAGVAKAFRIGANLVLTKPINVDQAKGTLRVARGLLRKGDGGKPAAAATAPAASSPAAAAPAAPAKPAVPAAPRPASIPAPARPAARTDAASAAPRTIAPPSVTPVEKKIAAPAAQTAAPVAAKIAPAVPAAVENKPVAKPTLPPTSANFSSAAASAPAPAREHVAPAAAPSPTPAEDDDILETSATPQAAVNAPTHEVPAPTFTFGGANSPAESSGGSKKIIVGIAAVLLVGALAYGGWSYYAGHKASSSTAQAPIHPAASTQAAASQPAAPATATSAGQPSTPDASASTTAASPAPAADDVQDITLRSAPAEKPSKSSASSKPVVAAVPAEAPLVIKGGAVPKEKSTSATADAPAPSVIGMDAPASTDSLAKIADSSPTAKPVLQKLNVSQGVSLGLLLKKVDPVYPSNAVRMRVEGTVLLDATISKTGEISNLKVIKGDPMLTRAASDAVKQWKYAPYLLNGEPVEIQTQITIKFKLPTQ
jgi:periplasmic protein TonB